MMKVVFPGCHNLTCFRSTLREGTHKKRVHTHTHTKMSLLLYFYLPLTHYIPSLMNCLW